MTPERWERIKDLFGRLEAVPEQDKERILEELCGEDAALFQEVAELLWPPTRGQRLLDQPLVVVDMDEPDLAPGIQVDEFTILEKLGSGGMGAVYLARHPQDPGDLHVAIKVLRTGTQSRLNLLRFRKEIQILAYLNHPNIAKFFRGGLLEDGRPYYIMEYIEGLPIVAYCNRHQLSLDKRLELFRKVCGAVQYAHRNLVIHRDIKPNNILITDDEVPKLLDFGVAKILKDDPAATQDATTLGFRPLTPQYASPEQLLGRATSTVSDVYSLGVLLHELLVGCRPSVGPLSQQAPEKPSRVVRRLAECALKQKDSPDRVCLPSLGMTAARLRVTLDGDLDQIILHALERHENHRYASVQEFSDDLNRYLKGYPVSVSGESPGYRLTKFIGRHRIGVSLVFLLFLLFVVFTQAILQKNRQILMERDNAQKSSQLLMDIFDRVDPYISERFDPSAKDLLDQGLKRIRQEQGLSPTTRAMLLSTLAGSYHALGDHQKALNLYRDVLALRCDYLGPRHRETAETMFSMARIFFETGQINHALEIYQETETLFREQLGSDHPLVAHVLGDLGSVYVSKGDLKKGETCFEESRKLLAHYKEGPHFMALGNVLNRYGDLASSLADYAKAESLYLEALAIKESLGKSHLGVGNTLNSLAILYSNQERFAEAAPLYQRSFAITQAAFGDAHEKTVVSASNLASFYLKQKELASAETLLRAQLPHLANIPVIVQYTLMNNLGNCLMQQEQYQEASVFLRQGLEILDQVDPAPVMKVLATTTNLAVLHRKQGQYETAEPLFEKAQHLAHQHFGKDHPHLARVLHYRAVSYWEQLRVERAEACFIEALAIRENKLGFQNSQGAESLHGLASLYRQQGQIGKLRGLETQWQKWKTANQDSANPRMAPWLEKLEQVFSGETPEGPGPPGE